MEQVKNECVAEVLERAAEHLEEKGWCRNTLQNPRTGAMCAMGAINFAVTGSSDYGDRFKAADLRGPAVDALGRELGVPEDHLQRKDYAGMATRAINTVVNFNNSTAKSGKDVTDLFRKAAKKLENA